MAKKGPTSQDSYATGFLAIDLGASTGRAILGTLNGNTNERLTLHELNRFEHVGLPTPTGPVWNLTEIWRNILESKKLAAKYCDEEAIKWKSIGVDCWGVDWAILGESGELLSLPHCYRDPQNEEACKKTLEKVGGFSSLYKRTGIQLMQINSIFQLAARLEAEPALFDAARHFLFLPDLFHYWLSGEIRVEKTIASTSGLLNVETRDWDFDLIEQIGLTGEMFGQIVAPGTSIGKLRPELMEFANAPNDLMVIAPACHDTASAVAAVPLNSAEKESSWAYLSSGTWSLLGAEIAEPKTTKRAEEIPFTNELGIDDSVRFLKNISGLWIVQELRREFNKNEDEHIYDFNDLMNVAGLAEPFRTLIDADAESLLAVGQMSQKIRSFAQCSDQPEPETAGDYVRCALESLAICYARTLASLEQVLDQRFDTIHIVGGGSKNELLNQMAANAMQRTIVCGPSEATAIGNILIQAMGCGHVADRTELREIVQRSFEPTVFEPESDSKQAWETAIKRVTDRF